MPYKLPVLQRDMTVAYMAHCPRCTDPVIEHPPVSSTEGMKMKCSCGCEFKIRLRDFPKVTRQA